MKTWRVIDLIRWTTEYFELHDIPTARLDAELLLCHLLGKDRLELYLGFEMTVFPKVLSRFRELVKMRAAHTPISYLTHHKEFFSLDFYVDARVLIPRPETESLVECVVGKQSRSCRVIDIGTGSGAIAISLAVSCPEWEIVASDKSADALEVAGINAAQHRCLDRITFLQGNLFEPLNDLPDCQFDWILSNAPYVGADEYDDLPAGVRDYEPKCALLGGSDGLELIRNILARAPQFLNPSGKVCLEIGHNQRDRVEALIRSNSAYKDMEVVQDYSGIDRVVLATI